MTTDGKVHLKPVLPSGICRKLGTKKPVFTKVGLFLLLAVSWLCWNITHRQYEKELRTLLFENKEKDKLRNGLSWNEVSLSFHLDVISFKVGGFLEMRSWY
jgi:hypothetical protein